MAANLNEYRKNLVINAKDINQTGRNNTPRIPVCFLIDCAKSDSRMILSTLNTELTKLMTHILNSSELRASVELMIMTYGRRIDCLRDFAPVTDGASKTIVLRTERTDEVDLSAALREAWYRIRRQKQIYNSRTINYCQPTIFLFSTGEHEADTRALEGFCNKLNCSGSVSIAPITDSKDPLFQRISTKGKAYTLLDYPVEALFQRIQNSMERMSESSGKAYDSLLSASKEWDL